MTQLRKFAKHSSQYFLGRAGGIALGLISFPLFTRLLSVEQYGSLNLITSIIFVAVAFSKMGMQQAVQRFHGEHANDQAAMRSCYSTLFLGNLGIASLMMGAYVAAVAIFPAEKLGRELKGLLLAAAALILIRALHQMVANLLQAESKSLAATILEFSVRALTLPVVALLMVFWQATAYAYIVGMVVVEALILVSLIPYLLRRRLLSVRAFDPAFFRVAFAFGVPLMWAEVGAFVLDSGDRVMIRYFLGPTALGYYTASYGVASYVREMMIMPVTLALFPICMETWNKSGAAETAEFISQSLRHYMAVAFGALCILTLCSHDLLVILASKKYEPAYTLLPVLLAGLVLASFQLFVRTGLLIHKRPAMITRSTFWAIVVNVVLNVALLPRMGVMGAAVATLFSYIVQLILMGHASMALLPLQIDYRAAAKYLFAAVVVVGIGWQIDLENRWAELAARAAISTLYFGIVWMLDSQSRRIAKRAVGAVAARMS